MSDVVRGKTKELRIATARAGGSAPKSCSVCSGRGHNAKTCPERPADDPESSKEIAIEFKPQAQLPRVQSAGEAGHGTARLGKGATRITMSNTS